LIGFCRGRRDTHAGSQIRFLSWGRKGKCHIRTKEGFVLSSPHISHSFVTRTRRLHHTMNLERCSGRRRVGTLQSRGIVLSSWYSGTSVFAVERVLNMRARTIATILLPRSDPESLAVDSVVSSVCLRCRCFVCFVVQIPGWDLYRLQEPTSFATVSRFSSERPLYAHPQRIYQPGK